MRHILSHLRLAGMALVCGVIGGCAVAPDDPGLQLRALALASAPEAPTVTIHPTRVIVKNGAGQVLLDGAPDRDNRLSSAPGQARFDGTLDIVTEYDNGTSKSQRLEHDPAHRVSLAWDEAAKQYVVKDLEPAKAADRFIGQPGWGLQVYGDYKHSPYDDTAVRSSASALTGRPDLSDGMTSLGFGIRRYFPALPSGIQPFGYVGFSEYFGSGGRQADVIYHFGATPDTGAEISEKRALLVGGGGQYLLANNLSLQLMLGLHATRLQYSVFSDERSGGGPFNQSTTQKWLFGPTVGAGLSFPLLFLGQGSPVLAFLQYQAMVMHDVSGSVTSPFTSATYSLRADGGLQHKFIFGVEKRF